MYQKSKGSLRHVGRSVGTGLTAALFAGLAAAVVGCPGPAPREGLGGSGGDGSSSASASSTSTTSSSTTSSSTSSSSTSSSSSSTSTSSGTSCSSGEVCAPSVSLPWQGPFQVFQTTGAAPSCPSGIALSGGIVGNNPPADAGPIVVAATCPKCSCVPPTNLTCGAPTATVYNSQGCGTTVGCASASLSLNKCTQLTPTVNAACIGWELAGFYLDVTATPAGSCTPSPASVPTQPPPWAESVVACQLTSPPTACSTGVCAPSSAKVCIEQAGDQTCPAAYPKQLQIYTDSLPDTRACTACHCGDPELGCTGGTATFSASACSTTAGMDGGGTAAGSAIDVPLTCTAETSQGLSAYSATLETAPTAVVLTPCQPSVSSPSGSATLTGLTTLCCLP